MDKTFEPQAIEQRWYQTWEENGYFAAPENTAGETQTAQPYCIMLPPPNVTGSLHMGHAFQHTVMDILTRYQRMCGNPTLWQPGTDHAGIATQMVVERQLAAQDITRHDLGREAFVDKIWEWKGKSGDTITRQMRRLGTSVDWSRERFTMDEGLSEAVTEVFVKLHEEGLLYRGKRLVNWDPVLHTAVSDLEVISEEENGHMWHLRYPIVGSEEHLIVATTRPETMLGDSAVAVHPDDERYQQLIGQQVELPLTGRTIPVIADDYVDPEFGSGCVKITPAHDFNDYEVGSRHDLPLINILTIDAAINEDAPTAYQGMDRYVARKKIVADLDAAGLLERIDDHKLTVPRGDRSNTVIEPYLTDQWFVKAAPLAAPAIEAVESGKIKFVPENWSKTYYGWMHNIQDWCVSRQLWWGHRIPAWYDEDGNIYVGRNEAEVREKHKLAADLVLAQDEDVLDTWFSSALWPFSTLGWPQKTPELATFYPTSVLVTGFDIIFFWVARMIMMGMKFMDGEVPFKEIYITGLIRDNDGQKMSKSKGNVLDPIDLIDGIELEALVDKRTRGLMQPKMAKKIEKATRKEFPDGIPAFGTDAMRFTFAALASTGRDIRFDMGRVGGYRNFCNKLWNAARYVLMNCEGQDCGSDNQAEVELTTADRWIISRLQATEETVHAHIQSYRFDLAAKALYEFVWYEYCDWYLELSKPALTGDASAAAQRGTRRTLVRVLESTLRLMHPVMPFITEEIWQQIAPLAGTTADTIMLRPYPQPDSSKQDGAAESEVEWIKNFVLGLRQIRGEMDIPPGKPLPILLSDASPEDLALLEQHRGTLDFLARIESVQVLGSGDQAPESATALHGNMKILVPMAGLIDKEAECARLEKQIAQRQAQIERTESKLSNENFVSRAPEAVVAKERAQMAEHQQAVLELSNQLAKIRQL